MHYNLKQIFLLIFSILLGYDTRAFDLSLNMGPTSYSNKGKAIMINMNNSVDDMELSPQSATNSYENRFQPSMYIYCAY